jgi:hypothetical protein
MLLLFLNLAVTIVSASLLPPRASAQFSSISSPSPDAENVTHTYTADEIHANIMAGFNPDKIMSSSEYYASALSRDASAIDDKTRMVYLSDRRTFVVPTNGAQSTTGNQSLEARQSVPCIPSAHYALISAQSYWSPWEHITPCLFAGGSGTASVTYNGGVTISTYLTG